MKTDLDHAIVLQLERTVEHLSDKVDRQGEELNFCDCDCGAAEVGELQGDIDELRKDLTRLRERMAELLRVFIEHLESCE